MKDFRVLIVDYNSEQTVCMANLLQRDGDSTTVVHTGEDAVAHALAESCDIAILDSYLPAGGGVEVFRLPLQCVEPGIVK